MHDECLQFNQNILADLVIVNTSQEFNDQTLPLGRIGNPCSMDHPTDHSWFGLGFRGELLCFFGRFECVCSRDGILLEHFPRFSLFCHMFSSLHVQPCKDASTPLGSLLTSTPVLTNSKDEQDDMNAEGDLWN